MKLLFEFNDTPSFKIEPDIDISFNNGEVDFVDFDDYEDFDDYAMALHFSHSPTINWGVETFFVISEKLHLESFPEAGTHHFKINGILYEIIINDDSDITSIEKYKEE